MQKYQPGLSWSRDAHDFLAELVKSYSEGRLDELLQVCRNSYPLRLASADRLASVFQADGG